MFFITYCHVDQIKGSEMSKSRIMRVTEEKCGILGSNPKGSKQLGKSLSNCLVG